MSPPPDRERLIHVKRAIELIEGFTGAIDYDGFLHDYRIQLSVGLLLEVIGEAADHISPKLKREYPEVPWQQMTDLRNEVHYKVVQTRLELIWEAATQKIPRLAEQIVLILQDFDRKS